MNAYKAEQDALRAYHLERVTRRFKMVISADNAEILAKLIADDNDGEKDVA